MDRREFIKGAGITSLLTAAAVAGKGCSPKWRREQRPNVLELVKSERAMTPEGAAEICILLDGLADSIEPIYPGQFETPLQAQMFVFEIAPYAVYERILPQNAAIFYGKQRMTMPSREVLPRLITRHYGGDATFHLMGTAQCHKLDQPVMDINWRYFNPASPLFDRPSSQIGVLVHETLHMQGICNSTNQGPEYNIQVESATQVATVEVMAAITRHRNKYGLLPFIREIQGYAADMVLLDAINKGDIDYYRKTIIKPIANDSYRIASFEKSMDHWTESPSLLFGLKQIVEKYGAWPFAYIREALLDERLWTRKLPYPNLFKRIELNDTAYVLDHLYELVEDYPNLV